MQYVNGCLTVIVTIASMEQEKMMIAYFLFSGVS